MVDAADTDITVGMMGATTGATVAVVTSEAEATRVAAAGVVVEAVAGEVVEAAGAEQIQNLCFEESRRASNTV
jgi:hypothetical protein